MKIKVTQNEVKINKDILNDGEYNIHKCEFDFDEEYNGLVQKAVFTLNDDTPYLETIFNNECNIPIEVLKEGILKIGVYAYETNNDELVLRYSPSPDEVRIFDGSYVKDAQNTEPITPTDKEQIEQAITDLQNDVADLDEEKQDKLISGENIKTINGESVLGSGNIEIDLSNYYNKQEIDQSQASQNANISKNTNDIVTLNNNLTNYSLITETGSQIVLNVNPSNYQMTAILKDKNGNTIYTSNVIDLPIESMIVNVTYDSTTKEIVFTLQNGTTLRVSVADLVSGLVSTDELNTILASYYTKTEIDNLLSGKVDTTTYTQGQATQDANIEENASNIDWLQTLVNQMPHVAGQGTDLSLESVLNYRLMKFLPQGVSSQESTEGKNLFHILGLDVTTVPKVTSSSSVLNRVNNNEIVMTAVGTWSNVSIDFGENFFNTNQNIIASADFLETISGRTSKVGLQFYGSTNGETYTSIQTTGIIDINYNIKQHLSVIANTGEYTYIRLRIWNNVSSTSVSRGDSVINVSNIMMALGTDDTYEPYTGGIPAPNPNYSIMPSRVTGENGLVICNENLFNKNSITPDSYLDSDGNIITNVTWSISDYIPVIAGEDYIYRGLTQVGNAPMSCYYDENKNFVSSFKQTTYAKKITIPAGVKYVRFTIEAKNTDDLNTFMLVKGATTPTTYIANQTQTYQLSLGNIELNSSSDGTIRDGIVGKPNEWYKREYIGKVVLDGSESYSRASSSSTRIAYETNIANIISYTNPSDVPDLISNRFTSVSYNASWKIGNISRWTNRYSLVLIVDPSISTISDFKTWLSQNNVTVWYQKSEYTDIPITDTTLINQLNDIYNNAHSHNGVTNITTTYEDGNEQMYLDIEALKNVWEVTE